VLGRDAVSDVDLESMGVPIGETWRIRLTVCGGEAALCHIILTTCYYYYYYYYYYFNYFNWVNEARCWSCHSYTARLFGAELFRKFRMNFAKFSDG